MICHISLLRAPLHQASESVCVNAAMTLATSVLIDHNGVAPKWVATLSSSDSIVVKLTLTLGVDGLLTVQIVLQATYSIVSVHWVLFTHTNYTYKRSFIENRPYKNKYMLIYIF